MLRIGLPFLLALVLAAAGCSGPAPTAPDVPTRQQVTLAPGQSAGIAGTAYVVRFDGVEGDSRCPADAICIQGGDAVVRVTMRTASSAQAYELHTGTMAPFTYAEVTVALEQLDPYPFSSKGPIAPGDYRATLVVTR